MLCMLPTAALHRNPHALSGARRLPCRYALCVLIGIPVAVVVDVVVVVVIVLAAAAAATAAAVVLLV